VLTNFEILDIKEDTCAAIILTRPFLATARCHIVSKNGNLPFDVGDDHVEFNLYKAFKFSSISDEFDRIDVIDIW